MKTLAVSFFALVCCLAADAQPKLTLSTTSLAYPGANIMVSATLSGSSGLNISGIGFTAPSVSGLALGTASTAAGMSLYQSGAGPINALLIGYANPSTGPVIGTAVYTDGVVATFNYTIPSTAAIGSTISLSLVSPLAASSAGTAVALTVVPVALNVGLSAACLLDINTAINTYLSGPTQSVLNTLTADLTAALTGGVCH